MTNLIPAVEVDKVQGHGDTETSPKGGSLIKRLTPSTSAERSKTVVIAFVGGVTHSELAALRKVAAHDEGEWSKNSTSLDLNKRQNPSDYFIFKCATLTVDVQHSPSKSNRRSCS